MLLLITKEIIQILSSNQTLLQTQQWEAIIIKVWLEVMEVYLQIILIQI